MSMTTLAATSFRAAPVKKIKPPNMIDIFLPRSLVVGDAKKEEMKPAMYRDDVNVVSN